MAPVNPDAHAASELTSIREITRRLNAALGATLVSPLAGSTDPKISYEWARVDGQEPKNEAVRRLRFAYTQWLVISAVEGEQVARTWFLGSNPLLNHDIPVDAIRENRFEELTTAIAAIVEDGLLG